MNTTTRNWLLYGYGFPVIRVNLSNGAFTLEFDLEGGEGPTSTAGNWNTSRPSSVTTGLDACDIFVHWLCEPKRAVEVLPVEDLQDVASRRKAGIAR